MIRIRGPVVVLHVTGAASAAGQVVVPIHVTLRTGQSCVRSS